MVRDYTATDKWCKKKPNKLKYLLNPLNHIHCRFCPTLKHYIRFIYIVSISVKVDDKLFLQRNTISYRSRMKCNI